MQDCVIRVEFPFPVRLCCIRARSSPPRHGNFSPREIVSPADYTARTESPVHIKLPFPWRKCAVYKRLRSLRGITSAIRDCTVQAGHLRLCITRARNSPGTGTPHRVKSSPPRIILPTSFFTCAEASPAQYRASRPMYTPMPRAKCTFPTRALAQDIHPPPAPDAHHRPTFCAQSPPRKTAR